MDRIKAKKKRDSLKASLYLTKIHLATGDLTTGEPIDMNHLTPPSDLKEASKEIKEKSNGNKPKRREIYSFDNDIRKKYGLSCVEACFLGLIQHLQCSTKGHCWAGNFYFIDKLGISDSTVERTIKKFRSLGLIWTHYYNSKNGKRRQIVTPDSIRLYQHFLKSFKSWIILKKFQAEFALINSSLDGPENPPKEGVEKLQVPDTIPPLDESHRPSVKMTEGPPVKMTDAIKTTSLPNKKNDVTSKDSDESGDAALLLSLKEELEPYFSVSEAAIGMEWYVMQPDSKKVKMRNPVACITQAIKDGYAHEEVAQNNAEVAAQLEKKREEVAQKKVKKEEFERNKKLAHLLIEKYSHEEGWDCCIASSFISIRNKNLKKAQWDKPTLMPDGSEFWGHVFVSASFRLPPLEFKKFLEGFIKRNLWTKEKPQEKRAI